MRVLLVCIARQENKYIREYVEYYRNIGVDNIVICDNNYDGEETFNEVLSDYIESGFVIIENVRNLQNCQVEAYNAVFNKYKNYFDWIMFFDCDEFLTIKNSPIEVIVAEDGSGETEYLPVAVLKPNTVKPFLGNYKFVDKDVILVNWMIFDDNDMIFDNRKGVLERFTHPCKLDLKVDYKFPENYHVKSIVHSAIYKPERLFERGKGQMHCPCGEAKRCNPKGYPVKVVTPFVEYNFDVAYLRHYRYKTISEFAEKKLLIQTPDRKPTKQNQIYLLRDFFKTNKITSDKIEYLRRVTGLNIGYR